MDVEEREDFRRTIASSSHGDSLEFCARSYCKLVEPVLHIRANPRSASGREHAFRLSVEIIRSIKDASVRFVTKAPTSESGHSIRRRSKNIGLKLEGAVGGCSRPKADPESSLVSYGWALSTRL